MLTLLRKIAFFSFSNLTNFSVIRLALKRPETSFNNNRLLNLLCLLSVWNQIVLICFNFFFVCACVLGPKLLELQLELVKNV